MMGLVLVNNKKHREKLLLPAEDTIIDLILPVLEMIVVCFFLFSLMLLAD